MWAIEDCRHVSGALERFLLARGERVVRVPPKLMAGARKSSRERGKSDAIDAVAIARAAIREGLDTLPVAQLAGPELDVRLLVDHRERLVAQRTALINDLRWGLHDLWPEFEIPPRALITRCWQDRVAGRLARAEQSARVRIARDELRRIRELTRAIDALERELAALVAEPRAAAAGRARLRRADRRQADRRDRRRRAASPPTPSSPAARRVGTDPGLLGPDTDRHRLDRGGNRQLNCALHRLAVSKAAWTPRPPPTSPASRPKARAAAKRCAASSATSPAASGGCCSQQPRPTPSSASALRSSLRLASPSTARHRSTPIP